MTNAKVSQISREHYYVGCAFMLLIALGACYIYLLSATVVHVVMQKEIVKNINDTHSEIAKLEAKYIDRQHAVSDDIASLDGYVVASNKVFIDKGQTSLVLGTNQNGF